MINSWVLGERLLDGPQVAAPDSMRLNADEVHLQYADVLWEKRKARLLPRLEAGGGEPSEGGNSSSEYSID